MTKRLLAVTLGLLLGGCSLAPDYQRPATPAGATWQASTDVTTTRGWKGTFSDPQLQQLITLALSNNRDLRIAALNVQSYEARYRIQRAAQLPTVGVDGSGSRQNHRGDARVAGGNEVFQKTRQIQSGPGHADLAIATANNDVEPDLGGLQLDVVVHVDVVVAPSLAQGAGKSVRRRAIPAPAACSANRGLLILRVHWMSIPFRDSVPWLSNNSRS